MKKLTYYEFHSCSSESAQNSNKYNSLRQGKLYSIYQDDDDNPENIDNIFFHPKDSNGYSAYMKLPKTEINFYDFDVRGEALQLDDFMSSTEINSVFGFFVSPYPLIYKGI